MSFQPEAHLPRTVVLALGDATVAHAFARILEIQGHVAAVVDSVEAAIESGPCDVFVGELGLERLDGAWVLDAMRAVGQDPKCVLIADGQQIDAAHLDPHLAVDQFLARPVLPEALLEAVETPRAADLTEDGSFGTEQLELDIAPHPAAAERAARELIAWCMRSEVGPATRARIGSAVAEIVDNAGAHGAGTIELRASLSPAELRVHISDSGEGFDPVAALTGDDFSSRTGLGRAHALADGVHVDSSPGAGTTVTLDFRISSVEFEDDTLIDLSDLDFFVPATSAELLATLDEDPDAPIVLSPALAVVVGRLLMGPDGSRVLEGALRS